MQKKKSGSASASNRSGIKVKGFAARAFRPTPGDDAPEITDAMLDRAEIVRGGKLIQRGRPLSSDTPKQPVSIRLDSEILEAYRASGPGWQGRINTDLLQIVRKKKRSA